MAKHVSKDKRKAVVELALSTSVQEASKAPTSLMFLDE